MGGGGAKDVYILDRGKSRRNKTSLILYSTFIISIERSRYNFLQGYVPGKQHKIGANVRHALQQRECVCNVVVAHPSPLAAEL